jgi:hypothetical protein
MRLDYEIEDLDGLDYSVSFEFHKECDGMIVFDGAWTIKEIKELVYLDGSDEAEWRMIEPTDEYDIVLLKWLSDKGEDKIYVAAEKEFK